MATLYTKKFQRKNFFMQQGLLASAGYLVNEYMLVLQPHEELCNIIMKEKKEFAEKYQCPTAMYTKAHVTLVRFKQHEMMEQHIVRQLKIITEAMSSFKVELKNFGNFPSHTIYFSITSKVQVMDAVKAIRAAQKPMKLDDENKPHFITEPYINTAYKLLPWQYEKAWLDYEHKHFHGRFIADHVLLLKRKEGSKAYQAAHRFDFRNIKTETRQGDLFT